MKKIYVVGAGTDPDATEKAKKILADMLLQDTEIICVGSSENIPAAERLSAAPHIVSINKIVIRAQPMFYDTYIEKRKCKGHERPYKYHR